MVKPPKNWGLGSEFESIDHFYDWFDENHGNSIELMRAPLALQGAAQNLNDGEKRVLRAEIICSTIDDLFGEPYSTVSFLDQRATSFSKLVFRYRQTTGHMSSKQMFMLKWVVLMSWSGFYQDQWGHEVGNYLGQMFSGVLFYEGTPQVDHFIIGTIGGSYEDNFSSHREKILNHIIPEKYELENQIIQEATAASKRPGIYGDFARRFITPQGGWATTR